MLGLITGVPGSGKSLFAVDLIEKLVAQNEKLLEEGNAPRPIYSDIDGITIEGVLPAPADWRDAPDGSVVFYDECQQRFGPDGSGRSGREDIQEFEVHRHRGFDIYLITQHPKLLHAHIRRLVGRHYHLLRMHGTQNAKVYQKDGQIDIDKVSQLNQQDNYMWSYPKQHFGKYKSATIHTHKAHMPKWMKRSLIGMAVALVILLALVPKAMEFWPGNAKAQQVSETKQPQKNETTAANEIIISPANDDSPVACITMGDKCSCYNSYGYLLEIPFQYCKKFTEETPRYIDLQKKQAKRAAAT